jgi:hypothetical protein
VIDCDRDRGAGGGFCVRWVVGNEGVNSEPPLQPTAQKGRQPVPCLPCLGVIFPRAPTSRAAQHGGGVLADDTANVTLEGILEGNVAGGHGGGVAALAGAVIRITSTARLRSNTAQDSGGGAFLDGATSSIGAAPSHPTHPLRQANLRPHAFAVLHCCASS